MNLLVFLLFIFNIINGQNQIVIDSLLNDLAFRVNDSLKVNTLNELSWEYKINDPKKAKYFAEKAIQLSDSISYDRGRITAMTRLGIVLIYEREYNKAEEIYLEVLELEEEKNYTYGIGRAQNQLSEIYSNKEELNKALSYSLLSLDSFKKINNKTLIAVVSNKVGSLYTEMGKYDKAMDYLLESIEYHNITGNKIGLASTSLNLGLLYFNLNNYENAIELLNQSKFLYIEIGDDYELAKVYNNIGVIELEKNKFDVALDNFNRSLQIKEELGIADKDPSIYNNLGNLYHKKNDFDKSLAYYKAGKTILSKAGDTTSIDIAINIADIYYRKNDLTSATKSYLEALKKSESTGQNIATLKILSDLSLCYSKQSDFNLALLYKNRYVKLSDSIENTYKEAVKIKSNYDEEQNEIALLEKGNELTKANLKRSMAETKYKDTLIYSLVFGILLLALLFFSLIRGNKQKQKTLIAEKDKEIKLKNAQELIDKQELRFNQARLEGQEKERTRIAKDLHDSLGSMLSMVKIHYKSVEENIEELKKSSRKQYEIANGLLDDACDEVRRIANDINSGILSKFGLVAGLEDLVNTINDTGKLKVEFNVYGLDFRLQSDTELTIYRVVQELINNVLKHANATELSLQLIQRGENLVVMVEDNGDGFSFENEKEKGMGLTNVSSRIEKLDGELQVDSSLGNGTSITFEIPLKINDI
ncbi:tetratricopeptide repeat-containing sensor histidine kinase [Psychroserpens sp.]